MIVWPHVRQNVSGGLREKYGVKTVRVKRIYFLENTGRINSGLFGYKNMDFKTDSFAHKIKVFSPSMSGSPLDGLSLHYASLPAVPLPTAVLSWD